MKKNERKMILFSILIIVSILLTVFRVGYYNYSKSAGNKVAIIDITGTINFASETEILKKIETSINNGFKGILIKINSPGGTVGSSQSLYNYIKEVRTKNNIIFGCSIGDIGASGAFYIAMACDYIVANPGSILGSIGVIIPGWDFTEIAKKLGIKQVNIKSGEMKDSLSPFKELTPSEKKYYQELVLKSYQMFFDDVLASRSGKITKEKLKEIADGRVFLGIQAKELGLIDEVGNINTVKNYFRGIFGEVDFVETESSQMEFIKKLISNSSNIDFINYINLPLYYYFYRGEN
ncbi:MAG TPA: signal peptide peptidase SppA [Spirochaetota bacterium]|nr:signal peptide peptidase SppA [Spirochaetota bacterium]HOM38972.1 signal peptide peptidase SppA [Spirochaetota bacterium]HPQ48368.1 signal peptide peptidase SppA [Spirochaetota bacterium]